MKMSTPTSLWCYCLYALNWNAGKVYYGPKLTHYCGAEIDSRGAWRKICKELYITLTWNLKKHLIEKYRSCDTSQLETFWFQHVHLMQPMPNLELAEFLPIFFKNCKYLNSPSPKITIYLLFIYNYM